MTKLGKQVYINFNCCILDGGTVEIGDKAMFAPNVSVYTATHPTDPQKRLDGLEMTKKIKIGNNCWIGGNSIIGPGVTIGDNSVVGTGSVVIKDVPPNVVVAGNPARIVNHLTPPQE